jgi:transcription initiation factor TFIID TATA-box-binding protein
VNVVVSTKLDREIDIEDLSSRLKNAEYEPQIWCGLVWRRQNPKSTIVMFSTGRISSVGTKSVKEAKRSLREAISAIPELSSAHYKEPEVVNIVAIVNLHQELELEKLIINLLPPSIYKPEQFPALIYKSKIANTARFLIFASGKISVLGAKSEKQVKEEVQKLVATIKSILNREPSMQTRAQTQQP